MTPKPLSFVIAGLLFATSAIALPFARAPIAVKDSQKVTVSPKDYPGLSNPNPRGWYYKCANVVLAKDGSLVACWQLSDNHNSLMSYIVVARSMDGGKTWGGYQAISRANVWEHQATWIVPQMSVLKDGRIVIISDRGQRKPGQDWPMLAHWQKPDRGMSNHLFWSADNGKTWTGPDKIDDVGGEPGYIVELSDGTLAYTRTDSATTDKLKNPPKPWGNIYYRNAIVFSDDGGKTWGRNAWLADSPFHGDCEVGLVELAPGRLLAATRIGLGNGRFGQPSRLVSSNDNGRTWDKGVPAPFYGQRVHIAKLQSGKLLATYRNVWGTPGSRALVFSPEENIGFQPTSWILDETRCELSVEALTLRTEEGKRGAVEFSFYPVQDDRSRVEIETALRVESADLNGCAISAGCWIRFLPNRVCLADKPDVGFDIDASQWHTYRIVRENGQISILVDGVEKLRSKIGDTWVREVRFGNRATAAGDAPYANNRSVSHWRSFLVKVANPDDYPISWEWSPAKGYPDQFRRDRVVVLDYAAPGDCGYSSWTQMPDGTIVILDYTSGSLESFSWGEIGEGAAPFIRAYRVKESDLVRKQPGDK